MGISVSGTANGTGKVEQLSRLQRFKWIPLAIEVFNEARNRSNWQIPDPSAHSLPAPADTTSASASKSANTSSTLPKRSRSLRRVKRRTEPAFPLLLSARQAAVPRQAVDGYQSVIRELRHTRRKLCKLESIHKQLTEIQSTFDARLRDIVERVEHPAPAEHVVTPRDHMDGPTL